MAEDGSVVIVANMDVSKAEKDLAKLREKIVKLTDGLSAKTSRKSELEEQARNLGARLDEARMKLEEMKSASNRGMFSSADITSQREEVAALQRAFNSTDSALEQVTADIAKSKNELNESTLAAQNLQQNIERASENSEDLPKNTEKAAEAAGHATSALAKFEHRVVGLAKRVFIFSVITMALRNLRKWLSNVVTGNAEATAAIAQLKAALSTLAQPILNVVIPAFLRLIQIITAVVTKIINFIAAITGNSTKEWAKQAQALNAEQDAIAGVGGAAEDASKQLASFDEINKLEGSGAGGGGGGAGGAGGADFSKLLDGARLGEDIEQKLTEIGTVAGLAMIGLGLLVAFSGINVPLGIGMIVVGALTLGIAAEGDPDAVKNNIISALKRFSGIILGLSIAFLIIGLLLILSGIAIGLGIGMLIIGVAGLVAEAKLNGDEAKAKIKKALQDYADVIIAMSITFLVLGIILLFVPNMMALGIGMIIIGVAGLVAEVAANWNIIRNKLTEVFREDGAVIMAISAAVLILGIILCFVPNMMLLGIAMIAIGAAGMFATIAVNWSAIKEKIVPILKENGGVIAGISAALMVIGLLLCFVPGMLPFGIGLLAMGAVGIFSVIAVNWNAILNKFKEVWQSIKDWWNEKVAPVFTVEYWEAIFMTIPEALREKIKDGLNVAITLLNRFIDWFNEKMHISWNALEILGTEVIPAGNIQLLKLNKIPMLATGAVIPPNREFLAMLGDQKQGNNIEAPEALIRKIVREETNGGIRTGGGARQPIYFQIDKRTFAKVVVDLQNMQDQFVGVQLGGAIS